MERSYAQFPRQSSERDAMRADRTALDHPDRRSGAGSGEDGTTPDELWARVLRDVRGRIVDAAFYRWLYGSKVVEQRAGTLVIGVRDRYAVDWVTHRLKRVIESAFHAVAGQLPALEVVVAPARRPTKAQRSAPTPKPEAARHEALREEAAPGQHQGRHPGRDPNLGNGPVLLWTDLYIKLKLAFRRKAPKTLKGARLSVCLCLALHVDQDGIAHPGIEAIMRETGYGRTTVCRSLDELVSLQLIRKCECRDMRRADRYEILGYAWMDRTAAPCLWEGEEVG